MGDEYLGRVSFFLFGELFKQIEKRSAAAWWYVCCGMVVSVSVVIGHGAWDICQHIRLSVCSADDSLKFPPPHFPQAFCIPTLSLPTYLTYLHISTENQTSTPTSTNKTKESSMKCLDPFSPPFCNIPVPSTFRASRDFLGKEREGEGESGTFCFGECSDLPGMRHAMHLFL